MYSNLLGTLPQIKPSRSSIIRLKNILAMFEALMAETMSKSELGGLLGLSPSCIRKNIKVLQDAGLVPPFVLTGVGQEAIYEIIRTDDEKIVAFANQIKDQIKYAEDVIGGRKRWEDNQLAIKAVKDADKITKSRNFTCYEYQPGRRIYSSEGMSSIAFRALSREQMKIDPMRQAGLL